MWNNKNISTINNRYQFTAQQIQNTTNLTKFISFVNYSARNELEDLYEVVIDADSDSGVVNRESDYFSSDYFHDNNDTHKYNVSIPINNSYNIHISSQDG